MPILAKEGEKRDIILVPNDTHHEFMCKRMCIYKRYTLSLHENASLRKDLENWRGKKFTEEELQGFDLEKLLGVNALITVVHSQGADGKTYSNIAAVSKLMKGMAPLEAQNKRSQPEWVIKLIEKQISSQEDHKESKEDYKHIDDEEAPF